MYWNFCLPICMAMLIINLIVVAITMAILVISLIVFVLIATIMTMPVIKIIVVAFITATMAILVMDFIIVMNSFKTVWIFFLQKVRCQVQLATATCRLMSQACGAPPSFASICAVVGTTTTCATPPSPAPSLLQPPTLVA